MSYEILDRDMDGEVSPLTAIQLRIDNVMGPRVLLSRSPREDRKRQKGMPRNYWKNYATCILVQIASHQVRVANYSYRESWLLAQLEFSIDSFKFSRREDFIIAVARDLKLYPLPPLWKITRRLQRDGERREQSRVY